MQQSDVFLTGEGDAYHQRNREKYARMIGKDPVLKAVGTLAKTGKRLSQVLEIGCATGFRLAEIRERYGSTCSGVEPSYEAVSEGKTAYPAIHLFRGVGLDHVFFGTSSFDLIVLSFVLHWVDRSKLLSLLTDVDRVLKADGYLVVSDFYPPWPMKVPYKHVQGVFTYKLRYTDIFIATGKYREAYARPFDADTLEEGLTDAESQGRCSLLEKGDFYQLCE